MDRLGRSGRRYAPGGASTLAARLRRPAGGRRSPAGRPAAGASGPR